MNQPSIVPELDEDGFSIVHSPDQIPAFKNEDEEDAWWSTHSLGEEFWSRAAEVPEEMLPPIDRSRLTEPLRREH
jgi:hypothetical protein